MVGMYVSSTLAGSVFVVGQRDDRSVTGPPVSEVGESVGGLGRPFRHSLFICPPNELLQHSNCVSKNTDA